MIYLNIKRMILMSLLLMVGVIQADLTPFNTQRVLIIYTTSIVDSFGLPGGNMYKDYFSSLIDDVNMTYEASEVGLRLQIAGVVWDKGYDSMYTWAGGVAGCINRGDLEDTSNGHGMRRYVSLMDRYGADLVALYHLNQPGGCGDGISAALYRGYQTFWAKDPTITWLWAHEMGHGQGLNHCTGHRVTIDDYGSQVSAPYPDQSPAILGITDSNQYFVDTLVETPSVASRGFFTTMSYNAGVWISWNECSSEYTHTYMGVNRKFRFSHQGAYPLHGSFGFSQWTGTFSNPDINWIDPVTSFAYATGGDSIRYINRLKYLNEGLDTYRDTSSFYYRNGAALIRSVEDTLRNLKGVPSSLDLTSDMSLGENADDSEWVYAHFAATESVHIHPGFSITGNRSMKISVGNGSGGGLPKFSARKLPDARSDGASSSLAGAAFRVKYDPERKSLTVSMAGSRISNMRVIFYDIMGRPKKEIFAPEGNGSGEQVISVSDFRSGVYLVHIIQGDTEFKGKFLKW